MRPLRLLLLLALALPAPARAQLRPLAPLDPTVFEAGVAGAASLGGAWLADQRAALAGVRGTLLEVGILSATVRTGRAALTLEATALRLFDDDLVFRAPSGGSRAPNGERRRDAGDVRLSTAVRLLGDPEALVGVRFGTRLPTTDNAVGLERDLTDFFALLFGAARRGPWRASAELGVGVHGVRVSDFEQVDVLLYAAALERTAAVAPTLRVLGHYDGLRGWTLAGIEDLGEVRAGVRVGRARWLRVEAVRGYREFSPSGGVVVSAGARW
ncbi:MAG TPA: hypothetical protein VMK65_02710 [Longimicrobiales bacterium]|nr:hypothetical protein [Longimicrobiales bacterium]